jgi:hypothetical protein
MKSLLILLLLIAAIPITVSLVLIQTRYFSRASSNQVQYLFVPLQGSMPPNQQVELLLNTGDQQVGFVRTVVTFNPNKIRLSGEVIPSTVLTTVNKKTSMLEANTTGNIEMVFSMWPGDATPSGLFNIAKMPFISVSTTPNDTASVNVQVSDVEIVDVTSNTLTPISDSFVFTLNPTQVLTSQPSQQYIVNININAPATVVDQQEFIADVLVNTNSIPLVGGDFVLQYNSNVLELLQADTAVFSQKDSEDINNVTGIYRVSLNIDANEESVSGTALEPLSLHFKALTTGNTAVTLSQETVVAGTGSGGQELVVASQQANILITESTSTIPQATQTPTNAPSATPTCTPRPFCTFSNPNCLTVEPPNGWCLSVVNTISPSSDKIPSTIPPRAVTSVSDESTLTPMVMPTPTLGVRPTIIPNAPSWFDILPPKLKGFLMQLYLSVFVYRPINFFRLLDGAINLDV